MSAFENRCGMCVEQGLRSTVRSLPSPPTTRSLPQTDYFWDEDGEQHSHDPNARRVRYGCSNNHVWTLEWHQKCWACDYGDVPDSVTWEAAV